jgi:hypothetical protein
MGKIHWPRVVLGGLTFLVVAAAGEIIWGLVASSQLEAVISENPDAIQPPAMAAHVIWNLVIGIAAVWLYASIRPRYGPGVPTALRAGLVVWILAHATFALGASILGFFPATLMVWGAAWGLVETLAATLAGAWVYREPPGVPQPL